MVPKRSRLFFLLSIALLFSSCTQDSLTPTIIASPATSYKQEQKGGITSQSMLPPTAGSVPALQQVITFDDYGLRFTLPPGYQTVKQQGKGDLRLELGMDKGSGEVEGYSLSPIGLRVFEKAESSGLIEWFGERQGGCYERGGQPEPGDYFIDPYVVGQVDFKGNLALRYESGCWPVPYEILIDRGRWVIALYYLRDYPLDYEGDFNQILASIDFFEPQAGAVETDAPVAPTLRPIACLDEDAEPIEIPPRQTTLEVRLISNGNLWVWQERAGVAVQISNTKDAQTFSFSPQGQVIAFTRGEPYKQTELWAINRDGSDLRLLISAELLEEMVGEPTTTEFEYTDEIHFLDWIEGEKRLGFEVQRSYNAIGGCCEPGGTWLVDVDSGQLSPWILPPEFLTLREGIVSPDGNQIARLGETSLTLVNADGSNQRTDVLTYPNIPQQEGGGFIRPVVSWAADSQSLAVVTYSENIWEPEATFTTWFVPIDGTPAQQLNTFSGFPFSVILSPDQRYLTYRSALEAMSNDWKLHLATFDGSRNLVYAEGHLMDFWGWSPDGVHFVFGQGSTRAPYLGSVCGGAESLLQPPEFPLWYLTWVDPERFVFISSGDGPNESQLRLGTVGNGSLLIGPHQGEYAFYQVVAEPGDLERQP